MAETARSSFLQTLKVLCAALMSSLVVVLVAVTVVLGDRGTGTAPIWTYAVVAGLAVVETTLIGVVGYRFQPVAPGTPEDVARSTAVEQVQRQTVLRFALAEAVALVALALAFVVDEGGLPLLALGVVLSEVLMFLHVWPSERLIARTQEALESQGGRSYLREALAGPAPARG